MTLCPWLPPRKHSQRRMELSSPLQACGEKQIYKMEVPFPITTQAKKEHLLTWK